MTDNTYLTPHQDSKLLAVRDADFDNDNGFFTIDGDGELTWREGEGFNSIHYKIADNEGDFVKSEGWASFHPVGEQGYKMTVYNKQASEGGYIIGKKALPVDSLASGKELLDSILLYYVISQGGLCEEEA